MKTPLYTQIVPEPVRYDPKVSCVFVGKSFAHFPANLGLTLSAPKCLKQTLPSSKSGVSISPFWNVLDYFGN